MKPIAALILFIVTLPAIAAELGPLTSDPIRSERALLIPAAGNVPGANGTHFRSDIQITNLRADATQRVQLHWIPRVDSGEAFIRTVEMAPLSAIRSEDFVGSVMQTSGLGSILVIGVGEDDNPDPLAELHAVSRIWTPQPGTTGTTSQSFTPVSLRAMDERRLTVFGQKAGTQFRTNVGVVNADPTAAHDFQVTVAGFTADGEPWGPQVIELSLEAWTMTQIPLNDVPPLAILQIDAAPRLLENETPRPWLMYASTVDNVTGDAWSHIGFPTFEPLEPTND